MTVAQYRTDSLGLDISYTFSRNPMAIMKALGHWPPEAKSSDHS